MNLDLQHQRVVDVQDDARDVERDRVTYFEGRDVNQFNVARALADALNIKTRRGDF